MMTLKLLVLNSSLTKVKFMRFLYKLNLIDEFVSLA